MSLTLAAVAIFIYKFPTLPDGALAKDNSELVAAARQLAMKV
jgi:hypothetical protein